MELTAATVYVRLNEILRRQSEIQVGGVVYWMVLYKREDKIPQLCSLSHCRNSRRIRSNSVEIRDHRNESGDDAWRGKSIQSFEKKDKWLNGPAFLWKPIGEWTIKPTGKIYQK